MATHPSPSAPASRIARGAIRVFVVDDSSLVRSIFTRIIQSEDGLELAGTASSAEEALSQLGSMLVHVVLLDLEMPGMGGMKALPEIIKRSGSAKVMVVSTLTGEGTEHTIQALSEGAADTLLKPAPGGFDQDYREKLVERIRALGHRPLRRQVDGDATAPAIAVRRIIGQCKAEVLAIGASTGGVHATSLVLSSLPPRIGVPILITQHLPAPFSEAYANQLQDISGRPVAIATNGAKLMPDQILLAPGDAHMRVVKGPDGPVVKLDTSLSETGCMPSVDPMFESLATVFGRNALCVVLTGMGRDGTHGARALAAVGAEVVVQNEVSSVVWGMPGSVAKAGFASAVLHPYDIANRIAVCTGRV